MSPQCRTPALGGDQRPGEQQTKPQPQTISEACVLERTTQAYRLQRPPSKTKAAPWHRAGS